ncbi:MAG TPA: hypothetical protein VFV35_01430, partial [Acidimicrobiales bacterium]|nr:hypothetical protein [Acidimicrobiales bacterium]
ATKVGEVSGQGNASRSSFLDLPLHLAPRDRLAALKDSFARSATVADPRPAEADLVLSLVQPLGEYVYRGRPAVSVVAGAPLRTCSRPVTRLTVIVLYHGPSLFFSITADEASLGERAPGFGDALVRAVETFEAELAASR